MTYVLYECMMSSYVWFCVYIYLFMYVHIIAYVYSERQADRQMEGIKMYIFYIKEYISVSWVMFSFLYLGTSVYTMSREELGEDLETIKRQQAETRLRLSLANRHISTLYSQVRLRILFLCLIVFTYILHIYLKYSVFLVSDMIMQDGITVSKLTSVLINFLFS